MKKLLLIFLACMPIASLAQILSVEEAKNIVKEKGVLEQKRVIVVDSTSKSTLYRRALEAFSDWTGADGRSNAGLDYNDKEEGAVNYKGVYFQGEKKSIISSIQYYTDFIMKVRCKDGRAQVTVIIPSGYAIVTDGSRVSWDIRDFVAKLKSNKETKTKGVCNIREVLSFLLDAMETALKKSDEEDF